ncbi:MAG TPA: aspartate--tRNA(Asn) ligase [Desulfurococcales archaeon]|nr:aspartate--tRNA(Asn) ligase [Desulfurococcales archaeon]
MSSRVEVYGHVMFLRDIGKVRFIILRTFTGIEQVVLKKDKVPEKVWSVFSRLGPEYFIRVVGVKVKSKIAKLGYEIIPEEIDVIATSKPLPIDLSDKVTAEFPTRIRFRYLDIRRPKVKAVFRVRATVVQAAREFLVKRGFTEVFLPIIIGSASEGGAELFQVKYFDKVAYLAQSGQLYKQSVVPVFGKVFTIGPSFRAEKSRTRKHLTEFWQIDVEEALTTKDRLMQLQFELVKYIYERVCEVNSSDLEILNVKVEVPEYYHKIHYDEAISILRNKGIDIEWGMDFGADEEKALCMEFDVPFFVTEFPEREVAFYYKLVEDDPRLAHRIDFYGPGEYGVEWSSGGLREHDPVKLEERMRSKGLDPKSFKWYLDMFKYGFPPHGGFGMGVERLMQTLLKLEKIHEAALYPRTPDILVP